MKETGFEECWICKGGADYIDSAGDYICKECKNRLTNNKNKLNVTFKEVHS